MPKVRAFVKTALKNVRHRDLTMSNNKKRGINIIIHVVVYFITPPSFFFVAKIESNPFDVSNIYQHIRILNIF